MLRSVDCLSRGQKGADANSRSRLSLPSYCNEEEESRADKKGWIFPSPRPTTSLTGHRDRMDKPFRRAVIGAGLDPRIVTPHVMRHTAITKLVQCGVDLPTIQSISGHKSLAMVLRYTHVHGNHIDEAIAAIGMAVPEPKANKIPGTATQGLHNASNKVTVLAKSRTKI
ncbi:MAG: tyrosine-type recombinase/integrase [Xanthobacteraceae bacterium]